MNEGMDKQPKHQPFRVSLMNWIHLMGSEMRMMSPHHSLVPLFFFTLRFTILRTQSSDPKLTAATFSNVQISLSTCACHAERRDNSRRKRWGKCSNVSRKCQLKITRVLEKVRSEGSDIFSLPVWHGSVYLTGLLADMMGSTLSVP